MTEAMYSWLTNFSRFYYFFFPIVCIFNLHDEEEISWWSSHGVSLVHKTGDFCLPKWGGSKLNGATSAPTTLPGPPQGGRGSQRPLAIRVLWGDIPRWTALQRPEHRVSICTHPALLSAFMHVRTSWTDAFYRISSFEKSYFISLPLLALSPWQSQHFLCSYWRLGRWSRHPPSGCWLRKQSYTSLAIHYSFQPSFLLLFTQHTRV